MTKSYVIVHALRNKRDGFISSNIAMNFLCRSTRKISKSFLPWTIEFLAFDNSSNSSLILI
jgi:hypothetical protein